MVYAADYFLLQLQKHIWQHLELSSYYMHIA